MATRRVYYPQCGAANQEGGAQCFACQGKLNSSQAAGPAWESGASGTSSWQTAPQDTGVEQWKVDQPTGPISELPARPVPTQRPSRRGFLTGLVAGAGAVGIAAFAALRFLPSFFPMSRVRNRVAPSTPAPASTPTVAELAVDTSQTGRLIVNGRSEMLQMAWNPTLRMIPECWPSA